MSFFAILSLVWGWWGIGLLITVCSIAAAFVLPLQFRRLAIEIAVVAACSTLLYGAGFKADEARHEAAMKAEKARQEELAKQVIDKDSEIARLNAAIDAANQEVINATPPNPAPGISRAVARRLRNIR